MEQSNYSTIVSRWLSSTPCQANLKQRPAVVLERVARGGGATNWFYCRNDACLQGIARQLTPGSVVSFYFDGRIESSRVAKELSDTVERAIASVGECVIGALCDDLTSIEIDFINEPSGFVDFLRDLAPSPLLFAGEFPDRDNDGTEAVTVTLPDSDGVVSAHPH